MKRKTLADFEKQHGGRRIAALEGALKAQAESRHRINLELPCADNSLVFGVIGDTHYGSMYEAKDECAAMYERFRAEGVKDVLHVGDVIDGHNMYKGQEFEIHAHGWAQQGWARAPACGSGAPPADSSCCSGCAWRWPSGAEGRVAGPHWHRPDGRSSRTGGHSPLGPPTPVRCCLDCTPWNFVPCPKATGCSAATRAGPSRTTAR